MSKHSGFELVGDIVPDSDNTRDLGSSSKRFANIYSRVLKLNSALLLEGDWIAIQRWNGSGVHDVDLSFIPGAFQVKDVQNNLILGKFPVGGKAEFPQGLKTDTIAEQTGGAGVTIDGVLLKDSGATVINLDAVGVKADSVEEKYSGDGVTFLSNIKTNRAHLRDTKSVSGTTVTISTTDPDIILVDLSGSSMTVNLPACADAEGRILRFIIVDQKSTVPLNDLTLDPSGSETIDGNATKTYTPNKYSLIEIISTGSEWVIMNENLK